MTYSRPRTRPPSRTFTCMTWLTLLVAVLAAVASSATQTRSGRPPPVRRLYHPEGSTIRIMPRGPKNAQALTRRNSYVPPTHSLRHDDTLLLSASIPSALYHDVQLLLRPTEHLFHPDAKVTFQNHEAMRAEYLRAEDWRVYTGHVIRPKWVEKAWNDDAVGKAIHDDAILGDARVMIHEVDDEILWDGMFTVLGETYHVLTRNHYERTRTADDADIIELGNSMVVIADSDIYDLDELDLTSPFGKRADVSERTLCGHDNLSFNKRSLYGRSDIAGGGDSNENYVSSINSTKGCPTSQKAVYMGVAADCNYVSKLGSQDAARKQIISNWNQISGLYRQNFQISLGLINIHVQDASCPSSAPSDAEWNVGCSDSVTLDNRLNIFSSWRSARGDDGAGLWHLMTACATGTEIGVAWLGTLCQTSVVGQNAAGAGVSSVTTTQWSLISHEIGHNFGAIHDCTTGCSLSGGCCPMSSSTCDAGAQYIMNPSTSKTEKGFSPCTVGNICTWIGNQGSLHCIVEPNSKTSIALAQCGNGIVEGDEQCDPGMNSTSNCCDPATCKFKNNAKCDPANSACCTDQCDYQPSTFKCRTAADTRCDSDEYCSGKDASCPDDNRKADGTDCGMGLACASGQCTSLDQQCKKAGGSLNLEKACTGIKGDKSCMVSCQDPIRSDSCTLLTTGLIDGSPCGYGGRCYNTTCHAGSWQDQFKSMYTQNLQISIPVTIGVALLVFAILSMLFRCCTSGVRTRRMPIEPVKARSYPPPPNGGMGGEAWAMNEYQPQGGGSQPLLTDRSGNGVHNRNTSFEDAPNVPPMPPQSYTDPYASGPGGYGNTGSYSEGLQSAYPSSTRGAFHQDVDYPSSTRGQFNVPVEHQQFDAPVGPPPTHFDPTARH